MFRKVNFCNVYVRNLLPSSRTLKSGTSKCHTSTEKWKKRIFSGIQPTGVIHVGNYFGAVRKWVELQNEGNDVIYSIVDLHSITLPQDPKELKRSILLMASSLIACGIDPSKSILFQQSKVAYHTLLSWVLGSLTTMTRLTHFPQFKEKSAVLKDIPLGLYIYPVLQAADVLLYKATEVPVGEDQVQHLHLAQHLVHTFNNRFGETFPVPACLVDSGLEGGRIRSLREPDKKMSKSHVDSRSRIDITDSADLIVAKIKKAVTDFTSDVTYDPERRPGVSNLVALFSLATGKTPDRICFENSHLDTGKFKLVVADALIARLKPIREEILRLNDAPEYLEEILKRGADKANEIAETTWFEVGQKIGLNTVQVGFLSDKARTKKIEAVK